MYNKSAIIAVLMIISALILSGCTSPKAETDWDGLVSSYSVRKDAHNNFEGRVIVEDTIKHVEYLPSQRVSEVTLMSNPTPVYLTGMQVSKVDDNVLDLSAHKRVGDEIVFVVQIIEENHYGEISYRIKEVDKDWNR